MERNRYFFLQLTAIMTSSPLWLTSGQHEWWEEMGRYLSRACMYFGFYKICSGICYDLKTPCRYTEGWFRYFQKYTSTSKRFMPSIFQLERVLSLLSTEKRFHLFSESGFFMRPLLFQSLCDFLCKIKTHP